MATETFEAVWFPYWYALDQPLKVGRTDDLWFFIDSPDYLPAVDKPVLYHGLVDEGAYMIRRCTVLRLSHPQLGDVAEVALRTFDYAFILPSGDEIEVNAEEEPGTPYDSHIQVSDWSLTALLRPQSDPEPSQPERD